MSEDKSDKTYYYKCTTCKKVIFNSKPIKGDVCPICMVNRGIYTSKVVEIPEEEGKAALQFYKKKEYYDVGKGIMDLMKKSHNLSSYQRMTLEEAIKIICNYEVAEQ